MKRIVVYLLICIPFLAQDAFTQGIEFNKGSFQEVLEMAKKENKMIFMDAYASWCGPCKMLSRNIFPKDDVGSFFNQNFIPFKQDMEKGEGPSLARKYRVTAYPTLFFIGPDGSVVHKIKGAPRTGGALINVGKQALAKFSGVGSFEEKYNNGDRSFETVYGYMKALNKDGQSTVKIANEYLDGQSDLSTPGNLRFLLEATTRIDSRIYTMFEMQKAAIVDLEGEQIVKKKIMDAAWNSVAVAAEFETELILRDAQKAVKKHVPERAEAFNVESELLYSKTTGDATMYKEAAERYMNSGAETAPLHVSNDVLKYFSQNDDLMKWTEKSLKKSINSDTSFEILRNYTLVLKANGKSSKALKVIDKHMPDNVEDARMIAKFQNLKQEIMNG